MSEFDPKPGDLVFDGTSVGMVVRRTVVRDKPVLLLATPCPADSEHGDDVIFWTKQAEGILPAPTLGIPIGQVGIMRESRKSVHHIRQAVRLLWVDPYSKTPFWCVYFDSQSQEGKFLLAAPFDVEWLDSPDRIVAGQRVRTNMLAEMYAGLTGTVVGEKYEPFDENPDPERVEYVIRLDRDETTRRDRFIALAFNQVEVIEDDAE